jgi:hypothetical protein
MTKKEASKAWKEPRKTKLNAKNALKNITTGILDVLLGIVEAPLVVVNKTTIYSAMSSEDRHLTVENISRALRSLKKRGMIIEVTDSGGQKSVAFTNKAALKLLDRISEKLDWDGKYRLLSFDIPEAQKTKRNQFRRAIKRLGFKQIQKSLWACNKNIANYVDLAAKEYNVDPYIAYFVADKSNIDDHIKKKFFNQE